jgi:PAS domain S-box-containing protein
VKSLQRKIAIGFGATVLVLLLVTCAAAWNASRFRSSYSWIKQTYEVFIRLDLVLTTMLNMEASTRGFLLTGDDEMLRPYRTSSANFDEGLAELRRLVANNPRELAQIEQLEPLAARAKASMESRIADRRARGMEAVAQRAVHLESQRSLTEFWRIIREIANEERRALAEQLKSAYEVGRITIYSAIAASLVAVGFVVVASLLLRRDLIRRHQAEEALKDSFDRIEDLYNKAPCGYHSLDQEGVIVAMNDTALGWLGYAREEVVGRMKFAELLAPESAAVFAERFAHFQRKGSVQNVEYEWNRKDGSKLPILVNATAIYDPQGNYVASRATVYDVTERKRAEDERDRFFNVARDLLCISNFEGYFTRLNPAWETIFGYTDDELRSKPFIEFVHPDDRDATLAEGARLTAGDESIEFENRYLTKRGTYRWLRWNARSVPAEKLIYASARDVTESKETQARIHALNSDLAVRAEQLEAANRELESFSYSVSHDLRAPLRHVDGFAGLLTKHAATKLDDESRRYVATISKAAKQMGALIDDLLAFSKIGRAPLRNEPVNQNQLVANVIANGRFDSESQITWEIGSLPEVHADGSMLRQVWTNLIDNAVKYSSKNPQPRIVIGGAKAAGDSEYVFFVRDNGVGFDMAYADKLFGVFQRLHGPAEFEGTGIGLANVRRIVARHGGRTWAEARVGEGAVFYFSLPNHDSAFPAN